MTCHSVYIWIYWVKKIKLPKYFETSVFELSISKSNKLSKYVDPFSEIEGSCRKHVRFYFCLDKVNQPDSVSLIMLMELRKHVAVTVFFKYVPMSLE